MYEYRASLVKVVDGDTVDFLVDLGFHVRVLIRTRLAGINAPELRGESLEDGKRSRDWLEARLREAGEHILIATEKTGKYGRWLARIHVGELGEEECLNDLMLELGLAEPYGEAR